MIICRSFEILVHSFHWLAIMCLVIPKVVMMVGRRYILKNNRLIPMIAIDSIGRAA